MPTIPTGSTYPSEGERSETLTVIGFDTGLGYYVIEHEDGQRFMLEPSLLVEAMTRPGAVIAPG